MHGDPFGGRYRLRVAAYHSMLEATETDFAGIMFKAVAKPQKKNLSRQNPPEKENE